MSPARTPRNPTELLGLDRDPALGRLMRACGVAEACITGGASDYDRFTALAAALPLCVGHPLWATITHTLWVATGLTMPLCSHTAHIYWEAWVAAHWYGDGNCPTANAPGEAVPCPLCPPVAPTVLHASEVAALPDPLAAPATVTDLPAWESWLMAGSADAPSKAVMLTLPPRYAFVRPNPYHAAEAIRVGAAAHAAGTDDRPTTQERDCHMGNLLMTQALRVVGKTAISQGLTLLLRGGDPAAVVDALAYLHGQRCLPTLVWFPDDPADAGRVSGLYAAVRTGVLVSSDDRSTLDRSVSELVPASYAAVAPRGRAVVLCGAELVTEG